MNELSKNYFILLFCKMCYIRFIIAFELIDYIYISTIATMMYMADCQILGLNILLIIYLANFNLH